MKEPLEHFTASDSVRYFTAAWPRLPLMWTKHKLLEGTQSSSFAWARCHFTFSPAIHRRMLLYLHLQKSSAFLISLSFLLNFSSSLASFSKYCTIFLCGFFFSNNKIANHGNCQHILAHCLIKSVVSPKANIKHRSMSCNSYVIWYHHKKRTHRHSHAACCSQVLPSDFVDVVWK